MTAAFFTCIALFCYTHGPQDHKRCHRVPVKAYVGGRRVRGVWAVRCGGTVRIHPTISL